MTFSIKQAVLCSSALLSFTVSATSVIGFCNNGTVDADWYKDPNRCFEVKNWAEAVCYAAPVQFSKKGMSWRVTEGPGNAVPKCRVFKDTNCQTTSGNGDLQIASPQNGSTDDILAFACYGPAFQRTSGALSLALPNETANAALLNRTTPTTNALAAANSLASAASSVASSAATGTATISSSSGSNSSSSSGSSSASTSQTSSIPTTSLTGSTFSTVASSVSSTAAASSASSSASVSTTQANSTATGSSLSGSSSASANASQTFYTTRTVAESSSPINTGGFVTIVTTMLPTTYSTTMTVSASSS